MALERLSVVDEPGGKGVLVDSNAVTDPLAERAEREGTEITHLLLTHHHYDHVVGARKLADRFGVPILAHELADELIDDKVDETFADGDVIETRRAADRGHPHPGPLRRPLRADVQRHRLPDRRRALQGHGRRHPGARARPASTTSSPRSWTS